MVIHLNTTESDVDEEDVTTVDFDDEEEIDIVVDN